MILTNWSLMLLTDINEMMLSSGKIYVVVGVMLIIFIGIIFYLATMDRKVKKIENELKEKRNN